MSRKYDVYSTTSTRRMTMSSELGRKRAAVKEELRRANKIIEEKTKGREK